MVKNIGPKNRQILNFIKKLSNLTAFSRTFRDSSFGINIYGRSFFFATHLDLIKEDFFDLINKFSKTGWRSSPQILIFRKEQIYLSQIKRPKLLHPNVHSVQDRFCVQEKKFMTFILKFQTLFLYSVIQHSFLRAPEAVQNSLYIT